MSPQTSRAAEIIPSGAGNFLALAALPNHDEARWLLQGRTEDGLNVFYQLRLVRPQGQAYQVTLPWQAQEVCPHCHGEGSVHSWNRDNAVYQPHPCPDCQGQGTLRRDSEISLTIHDGLAGQRSIRKSRAGRFNPRLNLRGDLIVNLIWVEKLPEDVGESPAGQATTS